MPCRALFLFGLFTAVLVSTTRSQIRWIDYTGNPILISGLGGSWDFHYVDAGTVVQQGDSEYTMWYSGSPDGTTPRAGRATSSDGIFWQKDPLNPVLQIGLPSAWDDSASFNPYVLVGDSGYTLWYSGWHSTAYGQTQIGRATSSTGRSWVKDSLNPVLTFGQASEWDASYVDPRGVLFDGSTYRMWYMGGAGGGFPTANASIGVATSPDGIHWTKYTQNPVLTSGPPGSWDRGGIGLAGVIYDSGYFRMWYTGDIIDYHSGDMSGIGYAVSPDGVHWKKYPGNPVMPKGFSRWADGEPNDPRIIRGNNELKMWYTARGEIGYAVSQFSPPMITIPDASMDFGSVSPGGVSDTLRLIIGNWGYTPLKPLVIESLVHHKSEFVVLNLPALPDSIQPFEDTTINIVFQPVQAGTYQDTLVIVSNDTLQPSKSVVLRGQILTTSVGKLLSESPRTFALRQNFPNPFNPTTNIGFQIAKFGFVSLKVYDVLGREVATLVNQEKPAGSYTVEFNASALPSSIYFYTLRAGDIVESKKMLLVK